MSHLIPHGSAASSVVSPWSAEGRAMKALVARTEVDVASLAAAAHVANAEIDAIDHVTQRAMQGAALVTQVESQLVDAVPAAAFRLAQIGHAHTMAMVNEVGP